MQRNGEFPAPVLVSPGRVGWSESELTAWKAARKAGGRERPSPFAKPWTPKLIETARSSKPALPQAAARPAGVSSPGRAGSQIQASAPLPPAAPDSARPVNRRARPVLPDQIDFGF